MKNRIIQVLGIIIVGIMSMFVTSNKTQLNSPETRELVEVSEGLTAGFAAEDYSNIEVEENKMEIVTSTIEETETVETVEPETEILEVVETSTDSEESEEVIIEEYEEEPVEEVPTTIQTWTSDDLYYLAKIIYCEGGTTCNDETLSYIGSVVVNRKYDSRFPDSIYGVIFQSGQYSTTWNGAWSTYEPDSRCYGIAESILTMYDTYGYTYLPSYVVFQANFTQGNGCYICSEGEYFCY